MGGAAFGPIRLLLPLHSIPVLICIFVVVVREMWLRRQQLPSPHLPVDGRQANHPGGEQNRRHRGEGKLNRSERGVTKGGRGLGLPEWAYSGCRATSFALKSDFINGKNPGYSITVYRGAPGIRSGKKTLSHTHTHPYPHIHQSSNEGR